MTENTHTTPDLHPELKRIVPVLAADGIRVFARTAKKRQITWIILEKKDCAGYIQINSYPLSTSFSVSMPVKPSVQHGSCVSLEHDQVPFDAEDAVLLQAVNETLVPQAYSPVTEHSHRNDGLKHYAWTKQDLSLIAGPALPEGGIEELMSASPARETQTQQEPISLLDLGFDQIIEEIPVPGLTDWTYLLSTNNELVKVDEYHVDPQTGLGWIDTGVGQLSADLISNRWSGVRQSTIETIEKNCPEPGRPSLSFWHSLLAPYAQKVSEDRLSIMIQTHRLYTTLGMLHNLDTGAWLKALDTINNDIRRRLA